jgi:hypothetical protein
MGKSSPKKFEYSSDSTDFCQSFVSHGLSLHACAVLKPKGKINEAIYDRKNESRSEISFYFLTLNAVMLLLFLLCLRPSKVFRRFFMRKFKTRSIGFPIISDIEKINPKICISPLIWAPEAVPILSFECPITDSRRELLTHSKLKESNKYPEDAEVHKKYRGFKRKSLPPPIIPVFAFHVHVPSFLKMTADDGSKAVYYIIQVETSQGLHWTMYRRYSEFRALYETLKQNYHFDAIQNCYFPPKELFFIETPDVNENRCKAFHDFCQLVVKLQPLPIIVQDFLCLDPDAKKREKAAIRQLARIIKVQAAYRGLSCRRNIKLVVNRDAT